MANDDSLYLVHMLEMARKSVDKLEGLQREDYDEDENLRLALTHLVQVIGEAASRVATFTQAKYPQVPWREITGMRNRIVHDYLNVDEDVVWEVATEDLPTLVQMLEQIISSNE